MAESTTEKSYSPCGLCGNPDVIFNCPMVSCLLCRNQSTALDWDRLQIDAVNAWYDKNGFLLYDANGASIGAVQTEKRINDIRDEILKKFPTFHHAKAYFDVKLDGCIGSSHAPKTNERGCEECQPGSMWLWGKEASQQAKDRLPPVEFFASLPKK